jgi:hypothetical protein
VMILITIVVETPVVKVLVVLEELTPVPVYDEGAELTPVPGMVEIVGMVSVAVEFDPVVSAELGEEVVEAGGEYVWVIVMTTVEIDSGAEELALDPVTGPAVEPLVEEENPLLTGPGAVVNGSEEYG